MNRTTRAMWRGSRLSGRKVGVEEKQQAVAHAKRQTRAADGTESEDIAIEPGQLFFLTRRVVENRLEDALESHLSTVLRPGLRSLLVPGEYLELKVEAETACCPRRSDALSAE